MIFLTRHGERSDFLNADFEDKDKYKDPPLTPLGHEQATKAGEEIKKVVYQFIANGKLLVKEPKFMVISSPFLRTVETASQIAKAFDKDELFDDSIFIQKGCSENLVWYPYDVMKEILFATTSKEEFSAKYLSFPIKTDFFDENLFVQPKFPEDKDIFYARLQNFYIVLLGLYMKRLAKEGVILIISTHGWGIKAILELLGGFDHSKGVDYCSLSCIHYQELKADAKGIILFQQSSEHLKDPI